MIATLVLTFVAVLAAMLLLGALRRSGRELRGSCGGVGCACRAGCEAGEATVGAEQHGLAKISGIPTLSDRR